MTFFEFTKSFVDSARDRVKTPITGAYTMAFIVYNWKPILYLLFSEAAIEQKLIFVDSNYSGWKAVFSPLIIAIIYIGLIQYVMWLFDWITTKAKKGRRTAYYDYKNHDLTELGKILQTELNNENIRAGKKEKEDLNNQIEKLNSEIQKMRDDEIAKKESYDNNVQFLNNNLSKQTDLLEEQVMNTTRITQEKNTLELVLLNDVMRKLTEEEVLIFISYVQSYIHDRGSTLFEVPNNLEDMFLQEGLLVRNKNGSLTTSDKGHMFYEAFTKRNPRSKAQI